jgi:hypothetical protein
VQPSIDLGPTLLDFFGVEPAPEMLGHSLAEVIAADTPVREAGLFGMHGKQVNVTDGRYVYMRSCADEANQPLYNYTLMPTAMRGFLGMESLHHAEMSAPFSFTRGCPTLKIPAQGWTAPGGSVLQTCLWDIESDPLQEQPLENPEIEQKMIGHLVRLMQECDAPPEQFERLGLERT